MRRAFPRRLTQPRSQPTLLRVGTAGILLAVAAFALSPSSTASDEPRTVTFNPVADARVEEANPSTNYGLATRLASDGDAGLGIESALRFDVSGISGTVESAKLRLYVVSDSTVDGPAVYPTGNDWTESGVTWNTRPQSLGPAVADIGAADVNTWLELDLTSLVTGNGSISVLLKQAGTDGVQFYARQGTYKPELVLTTIDDPIVMAAGDIACKPGSAVTATACRQQATSELLLNEPGLDKVLALGDQQYEDGLASEFTGDGAYDATWGRLKAITQPVAGNHEYHTPGAAGYFDYFGGAAGDSAKGYYSFDLGSWHLIALNSELTAAAAPGQEQWLRQDLATMRRNCVLAYWHRPRFSSGYHGGHAAMGPLWEALYDARADVILNGHDHDYERFALQSPLGQGDPDGIREFVVGTGGAYHTGFNAVQPNSEVRNETTYGAIKLTLHASGYDWAFVPEAGGTFADSGSGTCHDAPGATLSVSPSSGRPPLAVTADASRSSDPDGTPIASYTFDFGDGSPALGPQAAPTATHTYEADGAYTVTVTVTDTAGRVGMDTASVTVNSNVVRNPGFEVDTGGWSTGGSGAGITLVRVPGGHGGDWAAQLANIGTTGSTCVLNDSPDTVKPTGSGTYTGSLWVRADRPGGTLKLRFREWNGSTLAGTALTQATLTTSWQQVSVTYSAAAAGTGSLDFTAYVVGATPGTCFYADDASVTFSPRDEPPAASLAAAPSLGAAPLIVAADASRSSDSDRTPIASYSFDFGDGSPAVGPQADATVAHTYKDLGTYTVTVRVEDTGGQVSTATAQVVVKSNLVQNPGFETDLVGWNTSGSGPGVALTRSEGGHLDSWAAQLTNKGAVANTCGLNDAPNWAKTTAAGTYGAGLWVRAETPGATLKLKLREWSGSTLVGSSVAQVTLTTSWQQVSVTYNTVSPGSTLDFSAYVSSAAPGTCFYADDAFVVLG
jgi:acid phosphatase type 7